jgi:hypothetical protein
MKIIKILLIIGFVGIIFNSVCFSYQYSSPNYSQELQQSIEIQRLIQEIMLRAMMDFIQMSLEFQKQANNFNPNPLSYLPPTLPVKNPEGNDEKYSQQPVKRKVTKIIKREKRDNNFEQATPMQETSEFVGGDVNGNKKVIKIAVIDYFGFNGHGEEVVEALKKSLPPGVKVEIIKINLNIPGRRNVYDENGNLVGKELSEDDIVNALEQARQAGADVISMSNGFKAESPPETLMEEFAKLNKDGVIVVAAAGNDGDTSSTWPAAFNKYFDNVFAVGALDGDHIASYSNYGWPDIYVDGNFGNVMGTSIATPRFAAILAKILADEQGIDASNIKDYVSSNSVPISERGNFRTAGVNPDFSYTGMSLSSSSSNDFLTLPDFSSLTFEIFSPDIPLIW